MAGKLPPETENPVPEIESELILAAAVPVEVTVTDCVMGAPTETLPNASDVALRVNAGVAALSWSEIDLEVLPLVAVNVTFSGVPTGEALAVNAAVVAPAATITVAGTATALLLLETLTLNPPVGASPLRATVHVSFTTPLTDVELHESELKSGVVPVCTAVKGAV